MKLLAYFALVFSSIPLAFAQTAHLYTDSSPDTSTCAKQFPGSADWMLENQYGDKSVAVILDRAHTEAGNTAHREILVTVGPGQKVTLGCSTWPDERGRSISRSFKIISVKVRMTALMHGEHHALLVSMRTERRGRTCFWR
jgi:hypothetical protein